MNIDCIAWFKFQIEEQLRDVSQRTFRLCFDGWNLEEECKYDYQEPYAQ